MPAAGKPKVGMSEGHALGVPIPQKARMKAESKELMRSSKSRSRGKNRSNNNNRSPANNINRVFDSSGPEGKVRGTPQQIIDKYTQLARDAFMGNDRVAGENFQQHAEHYTRLLAEAQRDAEEKRQQTEQQQRERQQQKQREREQRDDNRGQNREHNQPQQDAGEQPQTDFGSGPQPDVMAVESEQESGLVETPEAAPKKPARPRKPRAPRKPAAEQSAEPAAETQSGDAPEAAE